METMNQNRDMIIAMDMITDHEKEVKINFKGEIIYTEPLGADKRIAEIVKDRVNDAL